MTPLHPLAAVAAGAVLGLAALTAPNTTPTRGLKPMPASCSIDCTRAIASFPSVGSDIPMENIHLVTMPGRYGLSDPPMGESYAVVQGQIVRVSTVDGRIRSVLRPAPQILD